MIVRILNVLVVKKQFLHDALQVEFMMLLVDLLNEDMKELVKEMGFGTFLPYRFLSSLKTCE